MSKYSTYLYLSFYIYYCYLYLFIYIYVPYTVSVYLFIYTAIKVWPHYQVLLVMTRGRSHMERSVTKFSLPSHTGNPSPNLVRLPSITGRITTPHKNLVIEPVLTGSITKF